MNKINLLPQTKTETLPLGADKRSRCWTAASTQDEGNHQRSPTGCKLELAEQDKRKIHKPWAASNIVIVPQKAAFFHQALPLMSTPVSNVSFLMRLGLSCDSLFQAQNHSRPTTNCCPGHCIEGWTSTEVATPFPHGPYVEGLGKWWMVGCGRLRGPRVCTKMFHTSWTTQRILLTLAALIRCSHRKDAVIDFLNWEYTYV